MLNAQQTTVTFVLKTASYSGHWSRGTTLAEAAKNLKRAGARGTDFVFLRLVFNDLEPWIDGYGGLNHEPEGWSTFVGITGTLSSLLKGQK